MAEGQGPARWGGKRSVQANQGAGDEGEGTNASWTDAAKTLADEHDIDITTVTGTGVNDKVTVPDVQAVIDAQAE